MTNKALWILGPFTIGTLLIKIAEPRHHLQTKVKTAFHPETVEQWIKKTSSKIGKMNPEAVEMMNKNKWYSKKMSKLTETMMFFETHYDDPKYKRSCDDFLNSNIKTGLSWVGFYKETPEVIEKILDFWSDPNNVSKSKTLVSKINDMIHGRTTYGWRPELSKNSGHILAWSNGAERWRVFGREISPKEEIKLDANMVFAPGDYETLSNVAPLLDPLPLYAASLEAKVKEGVPWDEGSKFWAKTMEASLKSMKEKEKMR